MKRLKRVCVSGSPYEMGLAHGSACREEIQQLIAALAKALGCTQDSDWEPILKNALHYEPYIREAAPHLIDEIRGIGCGAGISWEMALALQCRSELVYEAKLRKNAEARPMMACSSFALQRERTQDHQVIVGQNVDMGVAFEDAGILLQLTPEKGPSILTWTLAGTVGQVGLNSYGLARCGNVLISPGWRTGLPTTVLFRLVLEQPSAEACVELMRRTYRAKSNNFMLGDRSNRICDLETTVDDCAVLVPEQGVLYHTNHYLFPAYVPLEGFYKLEDSKGRLAALKQSLEAPGQFSSDTLKSMLASHEGERPLCVHATPSDQAKTVVSVLLYPESGIMEACMGCPCENEFVRYELPLA